MRYAPRNLSPRPLEAPTSLSADFDRVTRGVCLVEAYGTDPNKLPPRPGYTADELGDSPWECDCGYEHPESVLVSPCCGMRNHHLVEDFDPTAVAEFHGRGWNEDLNMSTNAVFSINADEYPAKIIIKLLKVKPDDLRTLRWDSQHHFQGVKDLMPFYHVLDVLSLFPEADHARIRRVLETWRSDAVLKPLRAASAEQTAQYNQNQAATRAWIKKRIDAGDAEVKELTRVYYDRRNPSRVRDAAFKGLKALWIKDKGRMAVFQPGAADHVRDSLAEKVLRLTDPVNDQDGNVTTLKALLDAGRVKLSKVDNWSRRGGNLGPAYFAEFPDGAAFEISRAAYEYRTGGRVSGFGESIREGAPSASRHLRGLHFAPNVYYRIQPRGASIKGFYSDTSEGEGGSKTGLHVFTSPSDLFRTDASVENYGNEIVVIISPRHWDHGDIEGVAVDPALSRVVARYTLATFARTYYPWIVTQGSRDPFGDVVDAGVDDYEVEAYLKRNVKESRPRGNPAYLSETERTQLTRPVSPGVSRYPITRPTTPPVDPGQKPGDARRAGTCPDGGAND